MTNLTDAAHEQGFGVWKFGDDCADWVAAESEDKAISWYERATMVGPEEYGEVTQVRDLDKLTVSDEGGGDKRTFREDIQRKLAETEDGRFPYLIASTEV